jgi:hypothetical protein
MEARVERSGRLVIAALVLAPLVLVLGGAAGLVYLWLRPERFVAQPEAEATLTDFLEQARQGEWEEAWQLLSNEDRLAVGVLEQRGWPPRRFYATGCEAPWTYSVAGGTRDESTARFDVDVNWRDCLSEAQVPQTTRLSFRLSRQQTQRAFFAGPLVRWRMLERWVVNLGLAEFAGAQVTAASDEGLSALEVTENQLEAWRPDDAYVRLGLRNHGKRAIRAAMAHVRCSPPDGSEIDRLVPAILPLPRAFPTLYAAGELAPAETRLVRLVVHGVSAACRDTLSLETAAVELSPAPGAP